MQCHACQLEATAAQYNHAVVQPWSASLPPVCVLLASKQPPDKPDSRWGYGCLGCNILAVIRSHQHSSHHLNTGVLTLSQGLVLWWWVCKSRHLHPGDVPLFGTIGFSLCQFKRPLALPIGCFCMLAVTQSPFPVAHCLAPVSVPPALVLCRFRCCTSHTASTCGRRSTTTRCVWRCASTSLQ